jgi:hypothetical protein
MVMTSARIWKWWKKNEQRGRKTDKTKEIGRYYDIEEY